MFKVDLFSGALFIKLSLGWNLYVSMIVLIIVAALFTAIGGLTAVMWTDFIQGSIK
jgi:Na+/proline symporter